MKIDNILQQQAGKNAGMTVPEGYFEDFCSRMADSLPEQDWEKQSEKSAIILPRSRWQKIRPYVYMAAMFMGIWCMMKMFNLMKSSSSADMSNNQLLMSAIDNDAFYYDYCVSDVSDSELYDDLFEQGVVPDDIIPN